MAKVLRHILAVLCLLAAVFFLLPLGIGILHFGMVWPAAVLLLAAAVLLPERAADETQLEAYYAALYESDGYFTYGVAADDVLPLDGYGFYEVS